MCSKSTDHGRRSDLGRLKRLLNFLPVAKMAGVARNLLRRRTKAGDGVGNNQVNLARIRLGGHVVAGRKAKLLAEELIQLVALVGVTLENLQEGSLCAGGALGAAELEFAADLLDAVKVKHQILGPLGGPLSDSDQLSCLKVRIRKSGLGWTAVSNCPDHTNVMEMGRRGMI